MSLEGCQIIPIDVNFHLQKSLKFSIKIQLTKYDPKNNKDWKVSPLMSIRDKYLDQLSE